MLRATLSIGASCTIGDVVCQSLSDHEYDLRRTAAFAASGLLVLGPLSYGILNTATALFPGSSTFSIARRILAIQACEPLRIGIFLPTPLLLSGVSVDHALDKAKNDAFPTAIRSWFVFTPFLFIGFRYLRPENRIPLLASVGACWNSYMSFVTHRSKPPKR